jgi:hypothetical protein
MVVEMINRIAMRENMISMSSDIPYASAGSVFSRIPSSFISVAHTALHRITLLIGLVVILLVSAGF